MKHPNEIAKPAVPSLKHEWPVSAPVPVHTSIGGVSSSNKSGGYVAPGQVKGPLNVEPKGS
jgi:hypothetical protein